MPFSILPKPSSKAVAPADGHHRLTNAGSISINQPGGSQLSISVKPAATQDVAETFARLARTLADAEATAAHILVFGSSKANAAGLEAARRNFGTSMPPITWVEGAACDGRPIAGIQIFAVRSRNLQRVEIEGRILGSVFESDGARHCMIGGLGPRELSVSHRDQTTQTLDRLQCALEKSGLSLGDTIRTWFFLDEILSWYDEFNRARTQAYSGVKFRSRSLPASTGVGAGNPRNAALAAAAWAVKPLNAESRIEEIASPLQCPAPCYGSSFSRAMEIAGSDGRQLLISGTASIEPGGKTAWIGDTRKQIALTMDVIEKILQSRGFTLADLTRTTAYFKHRADAGLFAEWCALRKLPSLPVVLAQCDVCRDDLLFELEADAWSGVVEETGGNSRAARIPPAQ